jgi:hypothetical protein
LNIEPIKSIRKARTPGLHLERPDAGAKKLNGVDADVACANMFACIGGAGIGPRLPVATAHALRVSGSHRAAIQPALEFSKTGLTP